MRASYSSQPGRHDLLQSFTPARRQNKVFEKRGGTLRLVVRADTVQYGRAKCARGGAQNFSKFSETSLNICAPPRDFFLKFEGSWPRVYMLYCIRAVFVLCICACVCLGRICIHAMHLCVRVSGTYLYSCYVFVRACVWDVFVFVLCICACVHESCTRA